MLHWILNQVQDDRTSTIPNLIRNLAYDLIREFN